MPVVIPIIAAAASYGGTAALLTGTFTVANVAAGLTMLGSILSIAGTVTKNEKLTKIGNGFMIVGGATSIINALSGGMPAGAAQAATPAEAAAAPVDVAGPGQISATAPGAETTAPADAGAVPPTSLAEPAATESLAGDLTPATEAVAGAPAAPTPMAASAPAPGVGVVPPPASPTPGIIGSFLKDNAAGVTLLGQGIMGAYGQQQADDAAKRKIEEEQRVRDYEDQRRREFNASVTGSRIQLSPWETAPTPNAMALPIPQPQQPGSRPLIGTVRRTA